MLTSCLRQTIWPSASRFKDLLNGANAQYQGIITPLANAPDRLKRSADDSQMSPDRTSDMLQREAFSGLEKLQTPPGAGAGVEDPRMMARMLGLEVPGIQASTSYFPGYEWWPSIQMPPATPQSMPGAHAAPGSHARPTVALRTTAASQQGSQQSSPVASQPQDWLAAMTNPAPYAYGAHSLSNYSYGARQYE
jgi:hypothetical protein